MQKGAGVLDATRTRLDNDNTRGITAVVLADNLLDRATLTELRATTMKRIHAKA